MENKEILEGQIQVEEAIKGQIKVEEGVKVEEVKLLPGQFKYTLPGWNEDDSIDIIIEQPRILELAKQGKIPNPLISEVVSLFKGDYVENFDELEGLIKIDELTTLFAKVCLIKPSYEEFISIGPLTDMQKMAIYMFAVRGPKAIIPFLKK